MKKVIIVLCVLICLCGCSNKANTTANDTQQEETAGTNTDNYLTKEEIKALIKKIDITKENWKDFFHVEIDYHEEVNNFGETVIDHFKVEANLIFNQGYIGDLGKIGLELHDNVHGNDVVWENLSEDLKLRVYYGDNHTRVPENITDYYEDGDVMYEIYMGYGYDGYLPFNFDNFTCNKAGGYVYKLDVPSEFILGEESDPIRCIVYKDADGNIAETDIKTFEALEEFMNG